MDRLQSKCSFKDPDVSGYEKQKGVVAIKHDCKALDAVVPRLSEKLPGNGYLKGMWRDYYGPRLSLAFNGAQNGYLARFPGHTVPGPGAGNNTIYVGSLAIDKFVNLLDLQGGLPPLLHSVEVPAHTYEDYRLIEWPWEKIIAPSLTIIHPARFGKKANPKEKGELLLWLKQEAKKYLAQSPVPVDKLFGLIRRAWSPYTKNVDYEKRIIEGAGEIIADMKRLEKWEEGDYLAFVFELESLLSCLESSFPLDLIGYGKYSNCWVEVGRMPISKIQCTELIEVSRLLNELVNIRTKGFAPIVVNEYGCDTDGTHRLLAAWTWNLLGSLRVKKLRGCIDEIQEGVKDFIGNHAGDMGAVANHEALRFLGESVLDPTKRALLNKDVMPYVHKYRCITDVPVTLLLEYSCGAVVKGPYDRGEAAYRVCPTVYENMASDRSMVLPARGPYHLTDRTMLPWFKVLFKK